MDKGFIKLNRKSFAHKFWTKARVLSEFEAWIDLIQSARYDEAVQIEYIDGREIKYGRGQYPASIRFLAKKWSWGDQKVRSFLNELKRDGSIKTDSSQGMNIITLCKYDKYNSAYSDENTANNTSDNTDISLILKELQQLKTQVLTQQITQSQHSGNTNNKKDNKEKESKKNNYRDNSNELPLSGTEKPHAENIDYLKFVEWFNDKTKGVFGELRYPLSESRKGMMRARIKEHGKDVFFSVILSSAKSNFMKGDNKRNWRATFDWIIRPTNFEKILTGNFDNRTNGNSLDDDEFINKLLDK